MLFKNDLNIILNEFNKSFNDNIEKVFNENEIILISFDLELEDSSFNNKLHLYLKNTDKNRKDNTHFTYTYDIETNELTKVSHYNRIYNYIKLSQKLKEYNINEEFINELKEISENPSSIMFQYKYYNNSIGIYLMDNDVNKLEKFLEKYNHKKLITNKDELTDLSFDFAINYDINENKINGTGFIDYF